MTHLRKMMLEELERRNYVGSAIEMAGEIFNGADVAFSRVLRIQLDSGPVSCRSLGASSLSGLGLIHDLGPHEMLKTWQTKPIAATAKVAGICFVRAKINYLIEAYFAQTRIDLSRIEKGHPTLTARRCSCRAIRE